MPIYLLYNHVEFQTVSKMTEKVKPCEGFGSQQVDDCEGLCNITAFCKWIYEKSYLNCWERDEDWSLQLYIQLQLKPEKKFRLEWQAINILITCNFLTCKILFCHFVCINRTSTVHFCPAEKNKLVVYLACVVLWETLGAKRVTVYTHNQWQECYKGRVGHCQNRNQM